MSKAADETAKGENAKSSAKPAAKARSAGAERVRRHREKMKAMGLKPVTLWVPDVDTESAEFKAQIAREIAAVNASAAEKIILEELANLVADIDGWK